MKKILLTTTLISLLALPIVSLAYEPLPSGPGSADDIIAIINTIADWLFAILLAVAVIFIIVAAYQFLTSGGDPARVQSARQALMYALVGVAVAFMAKGLVLLVRVALGLA